MWYSFTYCEYECEAKVFPGPSVFGIGDGRVSKLFVRRRGTPNILLNYDRGWDVNHLPDAEMWAIVRGAEFCQDNDIGRLA